MAFVSGVIGFPILGDREQTPPSQLLIDLPSEVDASFPTEFYEPGSAIRALVKDPSETGEELAPGEQMGAALASASFFKRAYRADEYLKAGGSVSGMSDWYVDRVWVSPSPLDFGSVISSKQIVVNVLNTFRYEARTLNAIDFSDLSGQGVDIVAPDPSPLILQPTQDASFTVEASREGAPTISGSIVLDFDHRNISLLVTGRRLILFWFEPEQPLQENLGWVTSIAENRDGNETRHKHRTTPRQLLEFRIAAASDREAAALRNILLMFRPFSFGVPIWAEQQRVAAALSSGGTVLSVSTEGIDHREGGTIMVWEPLSRTYFDAEIESFDSESITFSQATSEDISANAIVLPVRFGYIADEPLYSDAITGDYLTTVRFETTDNIDLSFADQTALEADFPVHPVDDLPVLSDGNILRDARQQRAQQTGFGRVDGDIGLFQLDALAPRGFLTGQKAGRFRNLAELRQWRSLFHWLGGSWRSFYLPTFRNDLPPYVNFNLNATTIQIHNVGVTETLGLAQPRKSAMLELADGRQFFAVVASSAVIDNDIETITLSDPFDAASDTVQAATAKISWLELVRIDGDNVAIQHDLAGQGVFGFAIKTVQR